MPTERRLPSAKAESNVRLPCRSTSKNLPLSERNSLFLMMPTDFLADCKGCSDGEFFVEKVTNVN